MKRDVLLYQTKLIPNTKVCIDGMECPQREYLYPYRFGRVPSFLYLYKRWNNCTTQCLHINDPNCLDNSLELSLINEVREEEINIPLDESNFNAEVDDVGSSRCDFFIFFSEVIVRQN